MQHPNNLYPTTIESKNMLKKERDDDQVRSRKDTQRVTPNGRTGVIKWPLKCHETKIFNDKSIKARNPAVYVLQINLK